MKKLFLLFFLIYQTCYSLPVDSTVFKYFPLNVGNKWTWYRYQSFYPGPGYESLLILGTQFINNKLYYRTRSENYNIYGGQHTYGSGLLRIDSATGNLYSYDSIGNNQWLSDSMNSKK